MHRGIGRTRENLLRFLLGKMNTLCWRRSRRQTPEMNHLAVLFLKTWTVRNLGVGALRTSGRSAMAHWVVFFVADLDLASREGPRRGGEILGGVLASVGHPRRF
jgi:hypothetical protein